MTTTTNTATKPRPLYEVRSDGKWIFYLDYSTLKDFSLCEQFFNYRHVQLIKPRGRGAMTMNIGSWWSLTLERIYDQIREFKSVTLADCQFISAKAWSELKMNEFELLSPKHWQQFGGHAGAIEMIDGYYVSHIEEDQKRFRIVSAESGFGLKGEVKIGEDENIVVYWVGKPDLSVLEGRRLCPLDHKTVQRIDGDVNSKYKPHPQIAGYIYAIKCLTKQAGFDVEADRAVLNICARTKPAEKPRNGGPKRPRFVRVLVTYNESELEEWRLGVMNKVAHLRRAIETGIYLWNENQCHNMYYKPCPYRGIDSNPPASRLVIIQGNYDKAERWIPYKVEEEDDAE